MTDYTRKEAETIRTAYSALAYLAECSSWANPPRLKDALQYETKQRSSQNVAKSLMVREALQGVLDSRMERLPSLERLWDERSPGLLTAYLFGGWCGAQGTTHGAERNRLQRLTDEFVTKAEASIVAHQDAIDRGWEAVA